MSKLATYEQIGTAHSNMRTRLQPEHFIHYCQIERITEKEIKDEDFMQYKADVWEEMHVADSPTAEQQCYSNGEHE